MISINFTPDIISKLQYLRYNPHPRVQQRVEVLLLKSKGVAHKEIARLTDLSINTINLLSEALSTKMVRWNRRN